MIQAALKQSMKKDLSSFLKGILVFLLGTLILALVLSNDLKRSVPPPSILLFLLLIAFQIKHFLADFPLQTPYMLRKFQKQGWAKPLLMHCFIHAGLTSLILSIVKPELSYLAAVDFALHFMIDKVKTMAPWQDPKKSSFWWALGGDQMLHHLTHYLIIFIILNH